MPSATQGSSVHLLASRSFQHFSSHSASVASGGTMSSQCEMQLFSRPCSANGAMALQPTQSACDIMSSCVYRSSHLWAATAQSGGRAERAGGACGRRACLLRPAPLLGSEVLELGARAHEYHCQRREGMQPLRAAHRSFYLTDSHFGGNFASVLGSSKDSSRWSREGPPTSCPGLCRRAGAAPHA